MANAGVFSIYLENSGLKHSLWGSRAIDLDIATFQDISDRKKSEAEREKFTQELFLLNEAFSRFVPRQFLQLLDKQTIVDIQQGDSVEKKCLFYSPIFATSPDSRKQ